jgi:hypothetical protein
MIENPPEIPSGNWAQWVAALATFSAVLVALFKDPVARLIWRPKLTARCLLGPPDCTRTRVTYAQAAGGTFPPVPIVSAADSYHLRIWIENVGDRRAEKVQVYAASLTKQAADGSFRAVDSFLPMNLKWAHCPPSSTQPEIYADGIAPAMGKHCDLAHIIDPSHRVPANCNIAGLDPKATVLAFEVEAKGNVPTHLVEPGVYRLTLRIAGANCRPVEATVDINHTGNWHPSQSEMFKEGIGVVVRRG